MVTGGFAIAVVVDGILSMALIAVLRQSRTGFKRCVSLETVDGLF